MNDKKKLEGLVLLLNEMKDKLNLNITCEDIRGVMRYMVVKAINYAGESENDELACVSESESKKTELIPREIFILTSGDSVVSVSQSRSKCIASMPSHVSYTRNANTRCSCFVESSDGTFVKDDDKSKLFVVWK